MPHGLAADHRSTWDYLKHPFLVLDEALPELQRPPQDRDPEELKRTYRALLSRGRHAMRVRTGVMVLLYFSIVASAVSGLSSAYGFGRVQEAVSLVLTFSTAATALLVVALFLLNRYVQNVQNHVLVVAMELSNAVGFHEMHPGPHDQ